MSFASVDDFVYRLVYRCPRCDTVVQGPPTSAIKSFPDKECPRGCRVLHHDTGKREPVLMETRVVTYGLASITSADQSTDIIDFFGSYKSPIDYGELAKLYITGPGSVEFLNNMTLAYIGDAEAFEYIKSSEVHCFIDSFVLKLLTDIAYRNGQELCQLSNKEIREHPMMQECLHHLAIVHGAGMAGLTKNTKIARMLEGHIMSDEERRELMVKRASSSEASVPRMAAIETEPDDLPDLIE